MKIFDLSLPLESLQQGRTNISYYTNKKESWLHEIDSKEARELLVNLADIKTKEAQILSDLAIVVNAEDLPPRQVGEITKSVLEHEQVCPELKYVTDEYYYQATHMILAASC